MAGFGSFANSLVNNVLSGAKNFATNFADNFGSNYIPDYKPINPNYNSYNTSTQAETPKQPTISDLINQTANSALNNIDFTPKTPNIQELTKNFKDGLNNISDVFDEDSLFGNVSKAVKNDKKEDKTSLENAWGNIDIPKMIGSSLFGPVPALLTPQKAFANTGENGKEPSFLSDDVLNISNTREKNSKKTKSSFSNYQDGLIDPWALPALNSSMMSALENQANKNKTMNAGPIDLNNIRFDKSQGTLTFNPWVGAKKTNDSKQKENIQQAYTNILSPNPSAYELGIENKDNPLSAMTVKAVNTRDYNDTIEGIGPNNPVLVNGQIQPGRKQRNFNNVTSDPITNLQLLATQWSKDNGYKNQDDINLPQQMLADLIVNELYYTPTKEDKILDPETGKVSTKPILMNDMRTAPRRKMNEYAGSEEESPYVEDFDWYLSNTAGGRAFADEVMRNAILDEEGNPIGSGLGDFTQFRYQAPDSLWREMTERVWEPYYEAEDDIGHLIRDDEGRIMKTDSDKVINWLNEDENIFYLDQALANPNSPTWFNFAGSSEDFLRHLDFLRNTMGLIDPYMGGSEYMANLTNKYPEKAKMLSDGDFILAAAMDLLGKQGGEFKRGGMDAPVFNALFEKLNSNYGTSLPYRFGNIEDDKYLSAQELGFNNPLRSNVHYFNDDPYQLLEPYYDKETGEKAFSNRYMDTILANNKNYGANKVDNIKALEDKSSYVAPDGTVVPNMLQGLDGSYMTYNGFGSPVSIDTPTPNPPGYVYGPNGEIIPANY